MQKPIEVALSALAVAALVDRACRHFPLAARAQDHHRGMGFHQGAAAADGTRSSRCRSMLRKTALLILDWNSRPAPKRPRPLLQGAAADREAPGRRAQPQHAGRPCALQQHERQRYRRQRGPKGDEKVVKGRGDIFAAATWRRSSRTRASRPSIIVGTSANSAVLYTPSAPCCAVSSRSFRSMDCRRKRPYQEQFTIWQIANGSQLSDNAVLTRIDLIKF
jgi:hypothetical protein